jgi:peptidyl-prolyl cis-trans isomerase B (cyclophilin B)
LGWIDQYAAALAHLDAASAGQRERASTVLIAAASAPTHPVSRRTRLDHREAGRIFTLSVVIVALSACAGQSGQTPAPSTSTAVTPARLGPTSTSRPTTLAPVTAAPAPTLIPLSPVTADDWIRGPHDAPASFVVYCDFQALGCARLASVMSSILAAHPNDVNLVYRSVPIAVSNDKAFLAGQAAQAASEQGAFWSMYDTLYQRWDEWVDLTPEDFETWLNAAAEEANLDVEQFQDDFSSPQTLARQEQAYAAAVSAGIPSVPFVFLNGDLYRLSLDRTTLEASIRLAALQSMRFDAYPPIVIDPDRQYTAHLLLNIGEVVIQLLPRSAPKAANSFVFLAQHGWYDGNSVFRVVPGRLVETGDPSGTGIGDAGYFFETEIDPALSYDEAGMVGLTNSGAETNSSIFFISLAPIPEFNGERTIFGRVVKGLGLLQVLDARDPLVDLLQPPQAKIIRLTIEVE